MIFRKQEVLNRIKTTILTDYSNVIKPFSDKDVENIFYCLCGIIDFDIKSNILDKDIHYAIDSYYNWGLDID